MGETGACTLLAQASTALYRTWTVTVLMAKIARGVQSRGTEVTDLTADGTGCHRCEVWRR